MTTSTPPRARLGPVLLAVFLDLLGFGLVIPLLSFYAEDFGATPLQVTGLLATYSIAQFLGAPAWGALSDRVGRRPVMIASVTASALFLAGFAAATSLWQLFVMRALHGLAAANIGTAQAYVADVTEGADRARGMGLIGAAFGVGFSVGPFLGGQLSPWGLSAPIWAAAALAAVNAVWIAWRLPESRGRGLGTPHTRRSFDPATWSKALRHPVVGLCIFLVFVAGFAFSMMESTFALIAEHVWQRTPRDVGNLFGIIGVVGIVVQGGLVGRLTRRFGEPALLAVGYVLTAVGMGMLGVVPAGVGLWVGCAVMATGSSLSNPALQSLISRGTSPEEQGAVLGVAQSFSALARATAPALGGWLFSTWYPRAPLQVGAVGMLVALLISLPATRRAMRRPGAS